MEEQEFRYRVPKKVLKEYRQLCIELEISPPKQAVQLIEQFIQIQKDNLKIQRHLRKMTK